jgi:predicted nucleic acid-binding protein
MIAAVVDTNIMVRGAIASHPNSASKNVIDALFAGSFLLLLSRDALSEIQRVLASDDIRAKHGVGPTIRLWLIVGPWNSAAGSSNQKPLYPHR